MKSPQTTRRINQTKAIEKLLANIPESRLTKNRYRVIKFILQNYFPKLYELYPEETLIQLFKDVIYIDRKHRKLTEGNEDELKKVLSQEYQIKELGYEGGYHQNVKQLTKIK